VWQWIAWLRVPLLHCHLILGTGDDVATAAVASASVAIAAAINAGQQRRR